MTVEIIEEIQKRTESRISAWWSAWKYVAILGLLLVVSVGVNLRQWSDHRGYVRAQAAELKAAAMEGGLKAAAKIASERKADNAALLKDLADIAERGKATRTVYRNAANKNPLPSTCAPGSARMDAVNAGADR